MRELSGEGRGPGRLQPVVIVGEGRGPRGSSLGELLGDWLGIARGLLGITRFFSRISPIFRSFLGDFRPKTGLQKTLNTLGVEESSSPRTALHLRRGDSSP